MKLKLFIIILITLSFKVWGHGTIIVSGIEHGEGYIDVKIYTNKDNFLNEEKALETIRKAATKGKTLIPLKKLHEGIIAVVVYHDEDGDGKLKTGLFWRPKEGFAFSNNYVPKGPPRFKKAAVQLIHGEPIEIQLNY